MADGAVCTDISAYLDSADQLPDAAKQMLKIFMRRGQEPERADRQPD